MLKIKRALISIYEKKNIELLIPFFLKENVEVYSTGGTYKHLKTLSNKLKLTEISTLTNFPEILNGRVKTLHPNVHAGILAKKKDSIHRKELDKLNIKFFDLVIVNLYPFEETIMNKKNSFDDCIEQIDIGGSTLLRAAAKNFHNIIILSHPEQVRLFSDQISKKNSVSLNTRKKLAGEAFRITAYYDSVIDNWFNKNDHDFLNRNFTLPMKKIRNLRYGENPHQKASLFKYGSDEINQVSGKEISYNNIVDLDVAINLAHEFDEPSCVIVKHGNPCGVSIDKKQKNAFLNALESDPVSAFGGIIAFNKALNYETAKEINSIFVELVIAPKISKKAKMILAKKKNLILLEYFLNKNERIKHEIRTTKTFLLVQEVNDRKLKANDLKLVTKGKITNQQIRDMLLGFTICKYINSNAIVLVERNKVLGIGVGQTNRLDSTIQAIKKGIKKSINKKNITLASDGFFPFPDIIKLCKKYSISSIIQPGGSIKDGSIIEEANKNKIKMVFTGIRNFKH